MTKINARTAEMIEALNSQLDARVSYEEQNNVILDENNVATVNKSANIFKTLADIRRSVTHEVVAKIFVASNVDAAFINRQERANKRMNVYCIEKVDNIARQIANVARLNSYTRNVLLTCHALTKNDDVMSHYDAQSSLCNDMKTRNKLVVRYATNIAASTANTQSSSSINALQVFNIIRETRDNANRVAYVMNYENENTRKLLEALNVAM